MPDYFTIPKTSRYDDAGFYEDGITLYSRGGIGNWKVAYNADENYDLRIGVYSHHNPYTGDDSYFFIVMSPIEIPYQSVDIRVVAPTLYMNFDYSAVELDSVYGWWSTKGISGMAIENFATELTVFTSLELLQAAMKYYDTSGSSGVVVTCIGSLIPPPPETEGVVVHCIGQLLNPYAPGGESGESNGGGSFDIEDSPIPLPNLPNLNVLQTGFVKAYNPTLVELQAFQDWLWMDNPFENVWRSILGNPYDYIIGLRAIPVLPDVSENPVQVTLGNVTTPQSVTMKPITAQYVRHNFGAVYFKEYSKSFLDYSPYTRVSLYLPYIGFVKVDADILNEKTVEIQYSIDILSGAFMAFVMSGGKVLYSFSGSMGADIPTTNQSYNNILSGIIGTVGGLAAMGAAAFTGGLAVPIGISGLANSAAGIISAAKASVENGNGVSGVPGVMGITYPYFIIMRPMQSIPNNIEAFTGFPSNILLPLNDVSGFTKVEYVHLENISATEAEKAEIMSLLKEGVIF